MRVEGKAEGERREERGFGEGRECGWKGVRVECKINRGRKEKGEGKEKAEEE